MIECILIIDGVTMWEEVVRMVATPCLLTAFAFGLYSALRWIDSSDHTTPQRSK